MDIEEPRLRPVTTIGHSTMEAPDFAVLCRKYGVREIIDIRSHPTSRWPQFRQEIMPEWLDDAGIRYEWEPGLGGWDVRHCQDLELVSGLASVGVNLSAYARGVFPKQRIGAQRVKPEGDDPEWTNQGLYDYSWFTGLDEFQQAAARLVERTQSGEFRRPAIMCCEVLWWKCHRSMVADYLVHVLQHPVYHLQPRLTSHRDALGNRIQRYPVPVREVWRAR